MNSFLQSRRGGLGERLVVGSFWNLVAMSFNQGTTLLVNIFLARILGKVVFGEYAIVQSTLLTAATFAELSLGFTAMKHLASTRDSDVLRAGRLLTLFRRVSLILSLIAAALIFAFSPWIAGTMLGAERLARTLALGAPFLFFQSLNGFQIGSLNGLESYKPLARAGLVAGAGSLILVSLGGYLGGRDGAVIGLSAAAFIRWAAHSIALSSSLKKNGIVAIAEDVGRELKLLINFTLPAALAAYVGVFATWFGNFILVRQEGGFAMMGIYAAANNLRFLVVFVPTVIGRVGFSMLSNQQGLGKGAEYRRVFRMNTLLMIGVTAVASSVFILLRQPVMRLFGDDFASGSPVLTILLASTLVEAAQMALVRHIQSHEKIWSFFLAITLPRILFFIAGVLFLIPLWGPEGLATVYLAMRTVELLLTIIQVRRLGIPEMNAESMQ